MVSENQQLGYSKHVVPTAGITSQAARANPLVPRKMVRAGAVQTPKRATRAFPLALTWNTVSTSRPGSIARRHCGMTRKLPPPVSTTLGVHVQLSRGVGRQAPAVGDWAVGGGVSSSMAKERT